MNIQEYIELGLYIFINVAAEEVDIDFLQFLYIFETVLKTTQYNVACYLLISAGLSCLYAIASTRCS